MSRGMKKKARRRDDDSGVARAQRRADAQPSDEEELIHESSDDESIDGDGLVAQRWNDGESDLGVDGPLEFGDSGNAAEIDPASAEEEQPLAKRVERLLHGSGPSRRKRNPGQSTHIKLDSRKATGHVLAQKEPDVTGQAQRGSPAKRNGEDHKDSSAFGRANKNRPQEVSSSRAVGRHREVVTLKRKAHRDPRFEGGAGSSKLNYQMFRKAYGFLASYQDGEIEELRKSLKKEKNKERSGRLQALLTRLQQERSERVEGDRRQNALRAARKMEEDAVAGGKKPFFLKQSEKRKISLRERYEGLKEDGKLTRFMEKKRKKNAAKDHRWLPARRGDPG